jgi:hypothetical protein
MQHKLILGVFSLLTCGLASAQPVNIYSETFNEGASSNRLLNFDAGAGKYRGNWRVAYGADGNTSLANGSTSSDATNFSAMISGSDFIFFTWSTTNITNKPLFFRDTNAVFLETGAYLDVANLRDLSFTYSRGAAAPAVNAVLSPTILIGSTWYITDATFTNASANTISPFSVNIQTALWRELTFNAGTEMSIGGTSGTLSALGATGSIESVGVWTNTTSTGAGSSTAQWRFDDLTVTAIPEPGTLALLGLAGLAALLGLRRRRN